MKTRSLPQDQVTAMYYARADLHYRARMRMPEPIDEELSLMIRVLRDPLAVELWRLYSQALQELQQQDSR